MFGYNSLEAEEQFHRKLCVVTTTVVCPIIFLFLRYVLPPSWGKNFRTLLGPTIPPRIGWCLFEIPNLYWSFFCYHSDLPAANQILLAMFVGHYTNRSIVYPLTLNPNTKPLPLEIALAAFLYTNLNGYMQARALCQFTTFPDDYLQQPLFWLGLLGFGVGVAINLQSDDILRNLRKDKPQGSGYVIPYGGFFRFVSAPHYFGEILEWLGFAVAGQNWAGWCFFAFTCANLIPRALAHHEWYHQNFKDYPRERTAVIPFLW